MTLPKLAGFGVMAIIGAIVTPVPVTEFVPEALPVTVIVAVREPLAAGVKVTENVQVLLTVTVWLLHKSFDKERSEAFVPLKVTAPAPITKLAVPVFVTVTLMVLPLPTFTFPKANGVGVIETEGLPLATPVPERVLLPEALPVTTTLAVREPPTVGVNVTANVHVEDGVTV